MSTVLRMAGIKGHNPTRKIKPGTPGHRACISREISQQIRKGKPRDQAIAIAFSVCGGARR